MSNADGSQTPERTGIADYRFIRVLGAGNHGVFFLAAKPERLPVSAEHVAVKVLTGTNSEDTFRRATRELAAFAAVQSPHLVTLYDAGQQGNDLYYSMEYLPGGSLAYPAEPVPDRVKLTAVADAARAAHALHEAGIAHNDIKPENVMLDNGRGKLSDLGLSRILAPGLTITGLGSAASVEYLDPALIRGDQPSRASDIFSLGATLHRVMAGVGLYGPLPSDNTMVAMRKVLSKDAVISDNLRPDVRDVVAAAINENPALRPATAQELAERIDWLAAAA